MTPAIVPAIAAPLADFFSWGMDSVGKLLRGEIDAEQTLAEVEQRRTECMAAIERERVRTLSDRALLDEAARRKFSVLAAPPAAEVPHGG